MKKQDAVELMNSIDPTPYKEGVVIPVSSTDSGNNSQYIFAKIDGKWKLILSSEDIIVKESHTQSTDLKCECGKEKHGFAMHSYWCDIYKIENGG